VQTNALPSTIVARTTLDASALVGAMQRELLAVDPALPVFEARTMAQQLELSLSGSRTIAEFLAVLGGLGLTLAGIGLYAVIAFAVSRRAREIGVRMALGARGRDVTWGIAGEVAALLGSGAGVGMALAVPVILAIRVFSNPTPGIAIYRPSLDPVAFLAIAGFIVVVGVVAAVGPARRAAKMDPLSALRHE
jgi:ABC-type antimicrobial peptide transport system permease subunit